MSPGLASIMNRTRWSRIVTASVSAANVADMAR